MDEKQRTEFEKHISSEIWTSDSVNDCKRFGFVYFLPYFSLVNFLYLTDDLRESHWRY